jgi:hypothetical protein
MEDIRQELENRYTGRTVISILEEIGNKNTCDEFEEKLVLKMTQVLLPNAVGVCGIIYPQGKGAAISVNQMAKQLCVFAKGSEEDIQRKEGSK